MDERSTNSKREILGEIKRESESFLIPPLAAWQTEWDHVENRENSCYSFQCFSIIEQSPTPVLISKHKEIPGKPKLHFYMQAAPSIPMTFPLTHSPS